MAAPPVVKRIGVTLMSIGIVGFLVCIGVLFNEYILLDVEEPWIPSGPIVISFVLFFVGVMFWRAAAKMPTDSGKESESE